MSDHGPVFALDEDEPVTWAEHFVKGLASLGLLGFAKFFFSAPLQWIHVARNTFGGTRGGTTGRDRMAQISWFAVVVGITTFLLVSMIYVSTIIISANEKRQAVWKGVRAWSKRTLAKASERVMDVPIADDGDED